MKAFFSFYLTILLFIQMQLNAESRPIYISLGSNCQASYALRHYQLREAAYPFDWMVVYDVEGAIQAIYEDFAHFLNPNYLEYRETHIYNSYYRMSFVHDFPTNYHANVATEGENTGIIALNYLDYLSSVENKYSNRISRLKKVLESGRQQVVFIRTHAEPLSAYYFVHAIKHKYPKLNFIFVSVHQNEGLNFNWNIPQVANVFVAGKLSNEALWWPMENWEWILAQIEILRQL
jgi:hypothetical protein